MSSQVSAEAWVSGGAHTRRELNPRQADTVARVLSAAHEEVKAVGYDALTIRSVAARAGVAPATAYTYFGSKNHLVAELFARQMTERVVARAADPDAPAGERDAVTRVVDVIESLTDFLAAEPEIAQAVTPALLATDVDVQHLRVRIGAAWAAWFAGALGADAGDRTEAILDTLMLAASGCLLQAGMGLMTYPQMGERLVRAARVVLGDDA